MERLDDHLTPNEAASMPSEADLRAAMAQSSADMAAGRTVPLEQVLADLDDVAHRIEARQRARIA